MRRSPGTACMLLLLLVVGFQPASRAHTLSESHSSWRIEGRTVHLTFTFADAEARRLSAHSAVPAATVLGAYVAEHVEVRAAGVACALPREPEALTATPGMHRIEVTFQCAADRNVEIGSSAFFELVPSHTDYVQIQTADGGYVEQLITKDRQVLDVDQAAGELESAGFFNYVMLGIMHIMTGVDHQAFLVGLIMLSRRVKDLIFVITGFTIGHSLTLALAVTGVLRPHAEYIDALIGLTIALVGSEIVARSSGRPALVALGIAVLMGLLAVISSVGAVGLPVLLLLGSGLAACCYTMICDRVQDAVRLRLAVTVVFGLVHGFGFAAGLLEMKLPAGHLAELLFGFNLGVELGQLALVLTVLGLVRLVMRAGFALPRPRVADACSMLLVAVGLFWFVSRSFV